jgi:hypothetical protein
MTKQDMTPKERAAAAKKAREFDRRSSRPGGPLAMRSGWRACPSVRRRRQTGRASRRSRRVCWPGRRTSTA